MKPTIRLSEFTHKLRMPDGWFRIFKAGTCERCGSMVQEPNALQVRPADPAILAPLAEIEQEPPEIWASDDDGKAYCDRCAEHR